MVLLIMNKKQKAYRDKYKIDKALIQFFTNPNIKREFQLICVYRGYKMKDVLEKMVIEFNKENEVKVLN